jgi:TRAP-type C4-dicarboxylate transport system permease small subunit
MEESMATSKFSAWAVRNKLAIDKSKFPNGVPFKQYIILANHWCHRVLLTIAQIAVVAMLIIVFWNVILRFVFNSGVKWVEEVPGLLVTLFTFIACAIGVRDHMHISVSLLYNRFPKNGRMRDFMDFLGNLATLACGCFLFYYGIVFIARLKPGMLPMTGWPTWIQYIPAPIGGFIMIFDSLLFLTHILDPNDLLYSEPEIDYEDLLKEQAKEASGLSTEGGKR